MLAKNATITALLLASFVMPSTSQAADWPQWLGPDRNGVSAETDLIKTWPASGPDVLWRAPLGKGFSAISISENRLYTMYTDGEGEFAICLNAANGDELWRFRTGNYYQETQGGDGPRATPTVEGDIVYVLGAEGKLYALKTADGHLIWQKDLIKEFSGEIPKWGFSTSPLIFGDLLFVEAGGVDGNFLVDMVVDRETNVTAVAIEKTTGKTVWTALNDKMSYSSPIAYNINGNTQVAFFNSYALVGLAPEDGSVLWRLPWKTRFDVSASTPMFIPPDRIFISAGDRGAVIKIKKDGFEEIWQNKEMKNHFGTSIYYQGNLYGFDQSILKCIDAETGEEKWKARGYAKGTLLIADGHLFVLGEQGNIGIVEATPERFNEKGNVELMNGRCWTIPSIANGTLYVRDEKEIVAVDLQSNGQ